MWTYELPEIWDEDPDDTLVITVDLSEMEEFATYENGFIQIADLSDSIVPVGTFTVVVTLTDGFEVVQTDITVLINEELPEIEEEQLIIEIEAVPTAVETITIEEVLEPVDETIAFVFDWRAAFYKKEKEMRKSGIFYEL